MALGCRPGRHTRALDTAVLVVVPTYDEAHNIGTLIERVFATVPDAKLLVVDDGSPDGTADLVGRLAQSEPRLHLLKRESKRGLGDSLIAGMRWGLEHGAATIVTMDGDLSHDPTSLPTLLAASRSADLVVGSRYVTDGSIPRWNLMRRMLSRGGNAYQGFMLRLGVRDATSGYRAYSAGILEKLDLSKAHLEGFGFQIEMVRRACSAGASVCEVPISFTERQMGESKIDRKTIAEALWHVTRWGVGDRLRRR